MSRGNFHRKSGVGDVVGQCMLIGGGPSGAIGSVSGRIVRQVGILRRFSDRPLLHASIFQSVMPGCNRPRSIEDHHRSDRHSFRIERLHKKGKFILIDFKKRIYSKGKNWHSDVCALSNGIHWMTKFIYVNTCIWN